MVLLGSTAQSWAVEARAHEVSAVCWGTVLYTRFLQFKILFMKVVKGTHGAIWAPVGKASTKHIGVLDDDGTGKMRRLSLYNWFQTNSDLQCRLVQTISGGSSASDMSRSRKSFEPVLCCRLAFCRWDIGQGLQGKLMFRLKLSCPTAALVMIWGLFTAGHVWWCNRYALGIRRLLCLQFILSFVPDTDFTKYFLCDLICRWSGCFARAVVICSRCWRAVITAMHTLVFGLTTCSYRLTFPECYHVGNSNHTLVEVLFGSQPFGCLAEF